MSSECRMNIRSLEPRIRHCCRRWKTLLPRSQPPRSSSIKSYKIYWYVLTASTLENIVIEYQRLPFVLLFFTHFLIFCQLSAHLLGHCIFPFHCDLQKCTFVIYCPNSVALDTERRTLDLYLMLKDKLCVSVCECQSIRAS